MRGESVHDKEGGLGDILGDVIDILFHASNVHRLDRLFVPLAPPATRSGGVLVGVCDEEGGNVHTIPSDGQGQRVTESISRLPQHRVVPKYEYAYAKEEARGKG